MTIPKIELKITANQLKAVYTALDFEMPAITFNGEKAKTTKSYYSLLEFIRIKLAKKILSHQHKTKQFKLSLEYFEALCLYKTLEAVAMQPAAHLFFQNLDQALA